MQMRIYDPAFSFCETLYNSHGWFKDFVKTEKQVPVQQREHSRCGRLATVPWSRYFHWVNKSVISQYLVWIENTGCRALESVQYFHRVNKSELSQYLVWIEYTGSLALRRYFHMS